MSILRIVYSFHLAFYDRTNELLQLFMHNVYAGQHWTNNILLQVKL